MIICECGLLFDTQKQLKTHQKTLRHEIGMIQRNNDTLLTKVENVTRIQFKHYSNKNPTRCGSRLLDTVHDRISRQYAHQQRQLDMLQGHIFQSIFGCVQGSVDMGNKDDTGLDIVNNQNKYVLEVKNAYNSDNSSSRDSNYNKLYKYKEKHNDYRCIYAVVNDNKNHINGRHFLICYKEYEIEYMSGNKLFEFVFGKDYEYIIEFIKKIYEEERIKFI